MSNEDSLNVQVFEGHLTERIETQYGRRYRCRRCGQLFCNQMLHPRFKCKVTPGQAKINGIPENELRRTIEKMEEELEYLRTFPLTDLEWLAVSDMLYGFTVARTAEDANVTAQRIYQLRASGREKLTSWRLELKRGDIHLTDETDTNDDDEEGEAE